MIRFLMTALQTGARALKRDWRSGELYLLLCALVIAVSAVSSVAFLAERVGLALQGSSAQMLGADLALRSREPIDPALRAHAEQSGMATSGYLSFASMLSAGEQMHLVSVKAVEEGYPLRGQMRLVDPDALDGVSVTAIPETGMLWADPQVLSLLKVGIGDKVQLGESAFILEGVIAQEPDRSVQFINVAPRVMIRAGDVAATGLLGLGSRSSHTLLAAGPAAAIQRYADWLEARLQRGQTVMLPGSGSPEVERSLSRASQFLALVALMTIVIAALAVVLAARRYHRRHQDGFAVMRCMGAGRAALSSMLLVQFALLGLCASLLGVAGGFVVQWLLGNAVTAWFDAVLPPTGWMPVVYGLATGLSILLGFAWPPLAALGGTPPVRVLRKSVGGSLGRGWLAYVPGVLIILALVAWVSGDGRMSVIVGLGLLAAFGLFYLAAYLLLRFLALYTRRSQGHAPLRFALAGMVRRKALTTTQFCALAIGLMVLLLLAITRTELLAGWRNTVPVDAPNTFLINIQPDQQSLVRDRLAAAGIAAAALSPMVRGRLIAIDGKAVDPSSYDDENARRLADREFNLSYTDTLPQSNSLIEGRWLDPEGSEVSLEDGMIKSLGIKLGDILTFEIAGSPVDVRVTSVREVKWDSFDVNFFALFSPSVLRDAPASFITSFLLPSGQAGLVRDLVREFPNITVLDVGAILSQVQDVLEQAIQAVQFLFVFTVLAGVLVLMAALLSTREERIQEVAILRVLGARGAQLKSAFYLELVMTGGLSGLMAAAGASAIAALLSHWVFDIDVVWLWWPWAFGLAGGILAACVGGALALRGVLRTPPLVSLRETA